MIETGLVETGDAYWNLYGDMCDELVSLGLASENTFTLNNVRYYSLVEYGDIRASIFLKPVPDLFQVGAKNCVAVVGAYVPEPHRKSLAAFKLVRSLLSYLQCSEYDVVIANCNEQNHISRTFLEMFERLESFEVRDHGTVCPFYYRLQLP